MRNIHWKRAAAFVAVFVIATVTFVFAQDAVADPAPEAASSAWWQGILQGALWGIMAAFAGYAKNVDVKTGKMKEKFEAKYMVSTACVGVLVGISAHLMGKLPADLLTSVEASPIFAIITFGVEALLKVVWRHGAPRVADIWNTLKGGASDPPSLPPSKPSAGSGAAKA